MEFIAAVIAPPRISGGSAAQGIRVEMEARVAAAPDPGGARDTIASTEQLVFEIGGADMRVEYDGADVGAASVGACGPDSDVCAVCLWLRGGGAGGGGSVGEREGQGGDQRKFEGDYGAAAAVERLVSRFGAGNALELLLKNPADADGGLQNKIRLCIPEQSPAPRIVAKITAHAPPNLWTMTARGTLTLANPFDCDVSVRRVAGDCLFGGAVVAVVDAEFAGGDDGDGGGDDGGVWIARRSTGVVSPVVEVALRLDLGTVALLMGMVGNAGSVLVSARARVECSFGGYVVGFEYAQDEIPLEVEVTVW